ncbi:MAG: DUF4176 domain-containing protein [Lachnospiraceae bacterium]|nr:DUF4176 domain-containing protein [Lachnospiraceae bacterium]
MKELLPIGSIVLLKNAKKRMMITGIRQSGKENPEKEYDYVGVLYPEGHIGEAYNFLFDSADIEKVFFRGFEDIERQEFIHNLEEYYQKEAAKEE